jgi:hypothetical protein
MNEKKQIAEALNEVMKEVKGIEKSLKVGVGNAAYSGVADKDVKRIIGSAFQKNGLSILPTDIEAEHEVNRWEEADYNGKIRSKQQVFTSVKTKYLLLHTSGESIEVMGYGHGVDSQDKSAPKALTYALKYALLHLTMAPTGTIDGDVTPSGSITPPPVSKPEAPNDETKENDLPTLNKSSKAFKDVETYFKDNSTTKFEDLLANVNIKYKTTKFTENALKKIHNGTDNKEA